MDLFLRISESPLDSVQQERNWSSFHSSVAVGGERIDRDKDRAHDAAKACSKPRTWPGHRGWEKLCRGHSDAQLIR